MQREYGSFWLSLLLLVYSGCAGGMAEQTPGDGSTLSL
jgi:hypothetical protein